MNKSKDIREITVDVSASSKEVMQRFEMFMSYFVYNNGHSNSFGIHLCKEEKLVFDNIIRLLDEYEEPITKRYTFSGNCGVIDMLQEFFEVMNNRTKDSGTLCIIPFDGDGPDRLDVSPKFDEEIYRRFNEWDPWDLDSLKDFEMVEKCNEYCVMGLEEISNRIDAPEIREIVYYNVDKNDIEESEIVEETVIDEDVPLESKDGNFDLFKALNETYQEQRIETKDASFIPEIEQSKDLLNKILMDFSDGPMVKINKIYSKSKEIEGAEEAEEDHDLAKIQVRMEGIKRSFYTVVREMDEYISLANKKIDKDKLIE